jgi:cullin-4
MNKIEEGVKSIHEAIVQYVLEFLKTGVFRNKTPNAYMVAYSAVHRLADDENDSSKRLYDYYIQTIEDYMTDAYNNLKTEEGERLIDAYLKENEQCKILIHWMRKVFTYLDKFYTKNQNLGSLCTNAMKIYFNKLFKPLKDQLSDALNKMIEDDRDCNVVARYKIKNLLRIFEEVDMKNPDLNKVEDNLFWTGEPTNFVLNEWFEKKFYERTEKYASQKADREIASMSAPEYINSALKFLDEEEHRKNEYINKSFHDKIDKINFKHLIELNAKTLAKMETGIRFMFINKKDLELKEAFRLISKNLESLKAITEEMDPFIRERGDELYNNKDLSKDPVKFIPELIKLKKEMDTLVEFAFENHILFQDTKNKAFSYFMNKEHYSKQLSNFCDYEMKVGMKGANESQIEEKLCNIINLFKCLNNKLIFQIEYAKKLSDRLIQAKSISLIAEKSLISKLKAEAGVTYVNKMTSMMQDLETSKSVMDQYKSQTHRGSPNGIPFNVQVLQHGAWEIDKSKFEKFETPLFLQKCTDDFNTFYISKHKTHKLTWAQGLGNIEIQFLYLKKNYQSVSTLVQYCSLIILEKYEKLAISKIAELLGLNQNLVLNEINALLYHPSFNPKKSKACGLISAADAVDGQDLKPENEITVNKDFMANSLKINTIPVVFRVSQISYNFFY